MSATELTFFYLIVELGYFGYYMHVLVIETQVDRLCVIDNVRCMLYTHSRIYSSHLSQ